jgi:hypothetical protein
MRADWPVQPARCLPMLQCGCCSLRHCCQPCSVCGSLHWSFLLAHLPPACTLYRLACLPACLQKMVASLMQGTTPLHQVGEVEPPATIGG